MRKALLAAFVACAVSAAIACKKTEPPPPPPAADAAPEPPAPLGDAAAPASSSAAEEPDAGEPWGKEADWSKTTIPGTKITYKYPGEVFLMDEDKTSSLLSSPIAVEPAPNDSGAPEKPYIYALKLSTLPLSVVDAAKAEKVPMFPDGKKESFVEQGDLGRKTTITNRPAYVQRMLAHGFDTTVYLVELAPKRTLVARVETVGAALRSRVAETNWHPEAWQLGLAEKVLGTLVDPAAPPAPKKDAGK